MLVVVWTVVGRKAVTPEVWLKGVVVGSVSGFPVKGGVGGVDVGS